MPNKYTRTNEIAGYSHLLSKRFDQFSLDYWPSYYRQAIGTRVQSDSGKWYTDLSISGIGACIFGYADSDVDSSVIEVIKRGVASSLNHELEPIVAKNLLNFIPEHSQVRFAKGGGEAMAIAVRAARSFSSKSVVLFSGYHGWSDWYLAANLNNLSNLNNHLIRDLYPFGVPKELCGTSVPFEYGDINDLLAKIESNIDNLACIVMEPARSHAASPDYLISVRNIASQFNIPLIFDEISCGFRQTSGPYAGSLGVTPDIYVFAKSIGNGYPIAAITGIDSLMGVFDNTFVSSTNWSEGVGLAAANAVLKKFQDGSPEKQISDLGLHWNAVVNTVAELHSFEIITSGLPGMNYMSHPDDPDLFRTFFTVYGLEKGFLVSGRYYPNTAQTFKNLDAYQQLLSDCIVKFKAMKMDERLQYCGTVLPGGFNSLKNLNF